MAEPFKKEVRLKMAYVSSTGAVRITLADRIHAAFAVLKEASRRRAVYGQTVRELHALSDRDLTDLGIQRHQISDLAKQAAYGA